MLQELLQQFIMSLQYVTRIIALFSGTVPTISAIQVENEDVFGINEEKGAS